MTRHDPRTPTGHPTDDVWIVGLLAGCGAIAAAFVLFVAAVPDGGKLASEIAQAEFPIGQPSPASAAMTPPAPAGVTRLAAGH